MSVAREAVFWSCMAPDLSVRSAFSVPYNAFRLEMSSKPKWEVFLALVFWRKSNKAVHVAASKCEIMPRSAYELTRKWIKPRALYLFRCAETRQ